MKYFNNICRICIKKYEKELKSINDTFINFENREFSMKEVLSYFMKEEKLNSQNSPQFICNECFQLAKYAFAFKLQCDESENKLKKYVITIKEIDEVEEENLCDNKILKAEESLDSNNENYCIQAAPLTSNKDKIKIRIKKQPKRTRHESKVEKNKLENSEQESKEENVFVCSFCKKSFVNKYIFVAHKKRHEMKGHFLCNICGKGFSSQGCLTRHNRMHTGERNFECKTCCKKFPSSNNLNLHMRIHTGLKPYLCTVCGKNFSHPTGLTYHMRTHTKERPYLCTVCGKRFTIQCHLDRHKKIHSGERPFSCPQCGKAFIKKIDMQRHEAIHSGEKPFVCNVCDKRFLRKVHLNLHMMLHTKERPHVCDFCGKGFIRAYYLRDHISKHHDQEIYQNESTTFNVIYAEDIIVPENINGDQSESIVLNYEKESTFEDKRKSIIFTEDTKSILIIQ